MRRLAVTALIAAVIGVIYACGGYEAAFADDEAPIFVKNGSIRIETGHGEFSSDGSGGYEHHSHGTHANDLWVRVSVTAGGPGACQGTQHANQIQVEYSTGAVVTFDLKQNSSGTRTVVKARGGTLVQDRPYRLTLGGTGYIQRVKANNWTCELQSAGQLDQINICSSSTSEYCK